MNCGLYGSEVSWIVEDCGGGFGVMSAMSDDDKSVRVLMILGSWIQLPSVLILII